MADAAPLLAAIASAPDDDLPRLVYADWLDEHGDPDRAEFIRLQIHTARVGPLDPTWAPAKLREYDLFKANEAKWRTPTAGDEGRMLMDRWRRGFPAAVMLGDVARGRLTSGEWANGMYDWSADPNQRYDPWPGGPVREVSFSGWHDGCDALLWHDKLRPVRVLSLKEWYAGVGRDRLEAFITDLSILPPGHFPELTTLSFGDGELTLTALETLADSAVLDTLTHLSLRFPRWWPGIDPTDWNDVALRLFVALAPRLESLSVENGPADLLAAFSAAEWPRLMAFDLTAASADDIIAITAARLPRLERLHVSASYFTDRAVWTEESVDHLARWPATGGVMELFMSGLSTWVLRRLMNGIETPAMEELAVFTGRAAVSELPFADLTERDVFGHLKNLRGPFTHADLSTLADPDVLPELHTIWSDDTTPAPVLRWRGGVRTVIPKDPPDSTDGRPSRRTWCSG
jgi:uncharacterized protein (TIGR02996 family)